MVEYPSQIMFATARPQRKAIYFSMIGEPPIKLLRYQQQFSFFDARKLGDDSIRFVHLGRPALDGGLETVFVLILEEVVRSSPAIVIVESSRAMMRTTLVHQNGDAQLTTFMQTFRDDFRESLYRMIGALPSSPSPSYSSAMSRLMVN